MEGSGTGGLGESAALEGDRIDDVHVLEEVEHLGPGSICLDDYRVLVRSLPVRHDHGSSIERRPYLRILQPLQAPDHVVAAQLSAGMELHAFPQVQRDLFG